MQEDYDNNFGFLIHDVARLMRTVYDRRMKPLGLTRSQWWVINHLYFHEGISQSDLAAVLDIERATLGRLLDRLEEKGWLCREPDASDRRINRVRLSENKRPTLQTMRAAAHTTVAEALAPLTMAEQDAMRDYLQRMKEGLQTMNSGEDENNTGQEAAE